MQNYLFLLIIILLGTFGQVLLKTVVNQLMPQLPEINSFWTLLQNIFIFLKNYKVLTIICLYAVGFFLWFLALTKFKLSYAFPLVSAMTYGLILLFSWIFLKENITTLRIIGVSTIVIGIILVAKS